MDCPKCGVHNLDEAKLCRMCGSPLKLEEGPKGPAKRCLFCGTLNELDTPFCSGCSKPMGSKKPQEIEVKGKRKKQYDRTYADYPASAKRTAWCSIAGIIMIMVATIVMIDVIFTVAESYRETQMDEFDRFAENHPALKSFMANIVACESIRAVFSILAFMGAFSAIRRLNFGLVIVGGISGILGLMMSISALVYFSWFLVIGVTFLAALVALGMVVLSRREFMLA